MRRQRGHNGRSALALLLLALGVCGTRAFKRSDWKLPAGFELQPYSGPPGSVNRARSLATSDASNGPWITYVSSISWSGEATDISALVDMAGRGEADYVHVIVKGLSSMPNGIAWNGGSLFIASLDPYKSCRIYRLDNVNAYAREKRTARLRDLVLLRDDLPIDFWHGWKYLRFGPDGQLYFPIGANCNACRLDGTPPNNGTVNGEFVYSVANAGDTSHVTAPYRRDAKSQVYEFGSIYRMTRDGKGVSLYATGIRNTVGFDWHPQTKQLYFTDNGRDNWDTARPAVTDNRPDCELNVATAPGQNFGFPFCHTGPKGDNINDRPYLRRAGVGSQLWDPELNPKQAAMKCNGAGLKFRPAIQAMGPHVSPLGMRFYRWFPGANFPATYNNSIFIAQHGSWNRQRPIGARVMRVVLDPANPTRVASYTPFLSGGVPGDKGFPTGPTPLVQPTAAYRGRPVDVEQLPDGSLLVSDDLPNNGIVYRLSYRKPTACRSPRRGSYDEDTVSLTPTTIPGASAGCAVNLGRSKPVPRYRRCVQAQVPAGSGHSMQLATSLVAAGGKLVLRGALLLPNFACLNSATGWAGFGLPRQEEWAEMVGTQAFITRPAPGTPTGATSAAYLLAGTDVSLFRGTTGFLRAPNSFGAFESGGALVTTFDILLPYAFQLAAFRAGQIPRPVRGRWDDDSPTTPTRLSFLLALGDTVGGAMQRHWYTAQLSIPFSTADVGAAVPGSTPVLNRGVGPAVPPPPPPSRPPPLKSRPPPPPLPPSTACRPTDKCCLDGIRYQACQTTSAVAGMTYTQFYTLDGTTLRVGIMAKTTGWIAWSYHPGNFGGMIGASAFFARPCPTCPTGVSTVGFQLGGYDTGLFSQPAALTFKTLGSGSSAGSIWASLSLPWPGSANTIKINYGGGSYFGGSATGADGMAQHAVNPPTSCVSRAGGSASLPDAC